MRTNATRAAKVAKETEKTIKSILTAIETGIEEQSEQGLFSFQTTVKSKLVNRIKETLEENDFSVKITNGHRSDSILVINWE